ncbi:MAG: T9SS type A sorting domain-containing protein [Bacteroidota bacterium]
MKKILFLFFLLIATTLASRAQCWDVWLTINFDDSQCMDRLSIDTTSNPNNIWQIGYANKSVMDSTICTTKVIVTDTTQPYPKNDTSSFIIKTSVTPGVYYDGRNFAGYYYVQSDSLKDYGKIEFSPDHGLTWIDMLNDTNYANNFKWNPKPILTGRSKICRSFWGTFFDLGSTFNLNMGDTVLFRFTFISDSTFDNLGGLMFNNINFSDFVEGMSEIRFKTLRTNVYPNPGDDHFTIDFENPLGHSFQLKVYDIRSKMVYIQEGITGEKVFFDAKPYAPDTYIYKLTDLEAKKRGWGRFVIAR